MMKILSWESLVIVSGARECNKRLSMESEQKQGLKLYIPVCVAKPTVFLFF